MPVKRWAQVGLWVVVTGFAVSGILLMIPIRPVYLLGLPDDLGVVDRQLGTSVTVRIFNARLTTIKVAPPIFGCKVGKKEYVEIGPLSSRYVEIHVDVTNKPTGKQTVGVLLPIDRNGREETVPFPVTLTVTDELEDAITKRRVKDEILTSARMIRRFGEFSMIAQSWKSSILEE